jgi:hypothetical protein
MTRHFTALALFGALVSFGMVGNAEACHKRKCACAPTPCAAPAPMPAPAPCATKAKHCGFKMPTLCHKKAAYAAPMVASCAPAPAPYAYAAPAPSAYAAPASYPTAMPLPSMQH